MWEFRRWPPRKAPALPAPVELTPWAEQWAAAEPPRPAEAAVAADCSEVQPRRRVARRERSRTPLPAQVEPRRELSVARLIPRRTLPVRRALPPVGRLAD